MTRVTFIGTAIIMLTLAGCSDNRDIQSLKSDIMFFSNHVANLDARITAVEEACLQINAQLNAVANRERAADQSSASKSSARAQPGEPASLLSAPRSSDKLTRASFGRRVAGMTPGELATLLGKPDQVNENAGNQTWTYQQVKLTAEDGGQEQSAASIIFEQGCVSRGVLIEDSKAAPSEPQEKETTNAPASTNQPGS